MRAYVYIDGLNLQYGSHPFGLWLDPVKFANRVLQEGVRSGVLSDQIRIVKVKYYTSHMLLTRRI